MKRWSRLRAVLVVVVVAVVAVPLLTSGAGAPTAGAAGSDGSVRLLDTRNGLGTVAGKLQPNTVRRMTIPGAAASGAVSAVLNVTATEASGPGWIRIWPCSDPQPTTSILNFSPAHVAEANGVVVKIGSGEICFSSYAAVHLVVDESALLDSGDGVIGITPARLLDTRPTATPLLAGLERRLKIAGVGGVPASATTVALNLTIDGAQSDGWVVVYPCGRPTTSSTVNFRAGEIVATFAFVALAGGDVCLSTWDTAPVVVDVYAYSTGRGSVFTASPQRLLDTRESSTLSTGTLQAGERLALPVAGRGGVAANAAAALLTVTIANADEDGFLTVWPCDEAMPNTSTMNTWAGQLRSNFAFAPIAADGTVCFQLYANGAGTADLVVDVVGWSSVTGDHSTPPTPPVTTPPATSPPATSPPPAGGGGAIPSSQFPAGNPGSGQILIQSSAQQGESSDPSGNFRIFCGYSKMSYDDPIVFPNQPGAAHLHAFFGNTGVNASSTYNSLRTTGNGTCSGGIANRSSYWAPVLMDANGAPVKPKYSQIYYKSGYRGVAPSSVNYIPDGLRIVAGKASATTDQSDEIVSWECPGQNGYWTRLHSCGAGNEISLSIIFPQCWNGRDLDSPDHISHMAYPSGAGCPASYPVAIPVITVVVYYTQPAGNASSFRLSSDAPGVPPGVSAHADLFEAWDQAIRNGWTDNCIRAHRDCTRGLGDGRQLVDPPGMTFD